MFGLSLGMLVESSVALLLAVTIGYCITLNQRLKRLHSDRDMLRKMITDLMEATGLANAAVMELKTAALEADGVLNGRLEEAERFGVELANHIASGTQLMDRIARITNAAKAQPVVDTRAAEPNRLQSALQQLAMRPGVGGRAA